MPTHKRRLQEDSMRKDTRDSDMARVEKAGRMLNRDMSGDAVTAEVSLDDDHSTDRNRFSPSKHAMVS